MRGTCSILVSHLVGRYAHGCLQLSGGVRPVRKDGHSLCHIRGQRIFRYGEPDQGAPARCGRAGGNSRQRLGSHGRPGGDTLLAGWAGIAELALLCASLMPDVCGVVALSPMHCIWGGMHGNRGMASKTFSSASEFTYRGKDFPCMTAHLKYGPAIRNLILHRQFELSYIYEGPLKQFDEDTAIRVENIQGSILFIYAKKDIMWPSKEAVTFLSL